MYQSLLFIPSTTAYFIRCLLLLIRKGQLLTNQHKPHSINNYCVSAKNHRHIYQVTDKHVAVKR